MDTTYNTASVPEGEIHVSSALPDSGARKEFNSGAVRDIDEQKGRCDLVPLEVVADLFYDNSVVLAVTKENAVVSTVIEDIAEYIYNGHAANLIVAMNNFILNVLCTDVPTAILEVSILYKQGLEKYGERNWEKGIPLSSYINSAVRHLMKYLRGDVDERHDRAFLWNLLCAVWTQKHRPTCIDLPFANKPKCKNNL